MMSTDIIFCYIFIIKNNIDMTGISKPFLWFNVGILSLCGIILTGVALSMKKCKANK